MVEFCADAYTEPLEWLQEVGETYAGSLTLVSPAGGVSEWECGIGVVTGESRVNPVYREMVCGRGKTALQAIRDASDKMREYPKHD